MKLGPKLSVLAQIVARDSWRNIGISLSATSECMCNSILHVNACNLA